MQQHQTCKTNSGIINCLVVAIDLLLHWSLRLYFFGDNLPDGLQNSKWGTQAMQCFMDSTAVMKMNREVCKHLVTIDVILNIYNIITVCFTSISIYHEHSISIKTGISRMS